jgi:hypothetical protein
LNVIESLIDSSHPTTKSLNISGDNFITSLRTCLLREGKEIPSFLRLLDELLTDYIDVSLPQNAEIVTKCVNILKIISEFIVQQKKEEVKIPDERVEEMNIGDVPIEDNEE